MDSESSEYDFNGPGGNNEEDEEDIPDTANHRGEANNRNVNAGIKYPAPQGYKRSAIEGGYGEVGAFRPSSYMQYSQKERNNGDRPVCKTLPSSYPHTT